MVKLSGDEATSGQSEEKSSDLGSTSSGSQTEAHLNTDDGYEVVSYDRPDEISYEPSPVNEEFDNNLPKTVTLLRGLNGSKLYLIGTAHFSLESQQDVSTVIKAVKPNIVVLELCKSRASILQMDEETIKREAKNLSLEKIKLTLKENGTMQGLMYLLLLNLSAQLTRDLGMAPGGEFRRAFSEVKNIPGCILHFGDRPIQVTLKRALSVLSWWQCIRLAWSLIISKEKVSLEDVEKCKQSDLLESMLKEMTVSFPELGKVFVLERDIYLTYSLQLATSCQFLASGRPIPTVAVGVVGIGHTPGIKEMWGKVREEDIPPIMAIKEASSKSSFARKTIMYGVLAFVGWELFKYARHSNIFSRLRPSLQITKFFSSKSV